MPRTLSHLVSRLFSSLDHAKQNEPRGVCGICGRGLNVEVDPLSGDCGGDCWGCIGWVEAHMGGDPEENISIGLIAKEISWGWREADGTPKPQAYFITVPQAGETPSPTPEHCRLIVPLLKERDGQRTKLELSATRYLDLFNIAWGEDDGDDYEHVTTNISPMIDGTQIDLFYTDEVVKIVDPLSGALLWESDGAPNVR